MHAPNALAASAHTAPRRQAATPVVTCSLPATLTPECLAAILSEAAQPEAGESAPPIRPKPELLHSQSAGRDRSEAFAQIARIEDRQRADLLRALIRRQYRQLVADGASASGTQRKRPTTQPS